MNNSSLIKHTILLSILLTSKLIYAGSLIPVPSHEKLIRIFPVQSTNTKKQQEPFDIKLGTVKNNYSINEAIEFKIKSKQQVFVYLFNIDPVTGKALTILPNRIQTSREIKYPGNNKWQIIPNPNLEFYADRSGTERIIMLASKRYIDMNRLHKLTKENKDFYSVDNPLNNLLNSINKTDNNGPAPQPKLIQIRTANDNTTQPLPSDIVIKEVNLVIN